VLHRRGIAALPDFVCNAGAVIGYRSALEARPEMVLADVGRKIAELTSEALSHPGGPLTGACERAAAFLRDWGARPPARPLPDAQIATHSPPSPVYPTRRSVHSTGFAPQCRPVQI
jgi:hypothetical protein